jgi:hypothetical protein
VIRIVCGGLESDVTRRCRIPTGALFSGIVNRDIWTRRSVRPVELSRDGSTDIRLTIPEEEAFSLVCACLAILFVSPPLYWPGCNSFPEILWTL